MSRRSDQRRAAVFALYQHDVTGRELDDLFERDASTFTRALAYAAQDYGEDLDERIERHAHGLDARPDRAPGAGDHAHRPARDRPPRCDPG